MPTPPKKHRTYCKSCEDFTIHNWIEDTLECETCNTKDTGYNLNDVEPKLLERQRERYNEYHKGILGGIYGAFLGGLGLQAIMELDKTIVVEDDAGQKTIDRQKKQEWAIRQAKAKAIFDDFKENYSNLGRNDKCSCGSGKKYKKCHIPIFREKGIKF